jgi:hypothetical protein
MLVRMLVQIHRRWEEQQRQEEELYRMCNIMAHCVNRDCWRFIINSNNDISTNNNNNNNRIDLIVVVVNHGNNLHNNNNNNNKQMHYHNTIVPWRRILLHPQPE